MTQAFISNRVVTPEGMHAAAVIVEAGRIEAVRGVEEIPAGAVVHRFGDLVLLPGLVDTHVHINEPGRTEWEGFATATRAAAAGGFTMLVDMPLNCLPETTSVAALLAKRAAAAGQCWVDWAAWGGLTDDNKDDLVPLAEAGVAGFKCFLVYPGIEGLAQVGTAGLETAAPILARTGLPLLVHAELGEYLYPCEDQDWRQYATWLRSRPDRSEVEAIRMLIELCRKYRFRLHIVHLATGLALDDLRAARAEGLPVTVETCPHYSALLCAEDIRDGATLFKCAPPIRSRANREALWEGLRAGVIDLIATDHSPCPPEMKVGDFASAWGGIASLSVAVPVVWTEMRQRGFAVETLARWMSAEPSRLAGMEGRKGAIAAGCDADFVVFDPEASFRLQQDGLHYRHKVSPYLGESLYGKVMATFLRGACVFKDGLFLGSAMGKG